jgi:transposase
MRTLKRHVAADALPTLETFLKRTKEARVFRRAPAVRAVVPGPRLQTVSDTLHVTYSALRKGGHRVATEGTRGLVDRPRSGRPRKVTCAVEQPLKRLVDHDSLEQGSLDSQWSCRELATVLAQQTGVPLGRERVRGVLKKTRSATVVPRGGSIPPPPTSRMPRSHSLPWRSGLAGARSFGSTKLQPSAGALPGPGWAGGAAPSGIASPRVHCARVKSAMKRRANARRGSAIARGTVSPAACCSASSAPSNMARPQSSRKSCPTVMPRSDASISIT